MVRKIIRVNDDQCTGCGECVRLCRQGALEVSAGKARLVADRLCDGLGVCANHCIQKALLLERREAAPFRGRFITDAEAARGNQLIAQRRPSSKGLGHHRHSRHRLRSVYLLEIAPSPFGRDLYRQRRQIERNFGNMVAFGGALQCLPSWVRSLRRVRLFVHAKLIINAARIRRRAA